MISIFNIEKCNQFATCHMMVVTNIHHFAANCIKMIDVFKHRRVPYKDAIKLKKCYGLQVIQSGCGHFGCNTSKFCYNFVILCFHFIYKISFIALAKVVN